MILSFLYCFNISQNLRLVVVSIPEVGSSRMISFELPINAMPTDSLRFYPPDRVAASWC